MTSLQASDEAEFYVLVRAKGLRGDGVEFLQARKTRPEIGLLSNLREGERWLKLRAYVPHSILLDIRGGKHDPIGVWGEPL